MPNNLRSLPAYARTPKILLRDPSISFPAKCLFGLLDSFSGNDGEGIFPKRQTLSEMLGTSLDTVDRGLKELREGGWLQVTARKRRDGKQAVNLYVLNFWNRTDADYDQSPGRNITETEWQGCGLAQIQPGRTSAEAFIEQHLSTEPHQMIEQHFSSADAPGTETMFSPSEEEIPDPGQSDEQETASKPGTSSKRGVASPRQRKTGPTPATEEQLATLRERFAGLRDFDDHVADARNHQAWKTKIDEAAYLRTWLKRALENQEQLDARRAQWGQPAKPAASARQLNLAPPKGTPIPEFDPKNPNAYLVDRRIKPPPPRWTLTPLEEWEAKVAAGKPAWLEKHYALWAQGRGEYREWSEEAMREAYSSDYDGEMRALRRKEEEAYKSEVETYEMDMLAWERALGAEE